MNDQQEFEDAIGCALAAIRVGDSDGTMDALADLAALGETALRAAAIKLATAGAGLIRRLFPDPAVDPLVELRLTDIEGSEVDIDELEPTLRSAIRMVLSLVNGSDQDAMDQLDLVCGTGGQVELASVVVQLLMWTVQMQEDGALPPA
jgi:predicted TPR repeat methyltransferase